MEENAVRLLVRCYRYLNHARGRRPGQERILYLLMKNETMSQKELQAQMGIAQGSLSEILIKLENHGLVEKKKNLADARSVVLTLSEKGRTIAEANHKLWREKEEHLLDALSEEEKESLKSICEKLLKSWEDEHA